MALGLPSYAFRISWPEKVVMILYIEHCDDIMNLRNFFLKIKTKLSNSRGKSRRNHMFPYHRPYNYIF